MKKQIEDLIKEYVRKYPEEKSVKTRWKEPIVAFADAGDEMFKKLKEVISPSHALPEDFLPDARTIITYFLPFADFVVKSNIEGRVSSKIWAIAYIETNQLIADLNKYIQKQLRQSRYNSTIIPATHNFDEQKLISEWSHRHVAYIAGLGKFGLNNMLITDKGCCGRIGSIVTNLKLEPTIRDDKEYCLYKARGTCNRCVERCVNDALKINSFNRQKCYEMCLSNAEIYSDLGLADICGKCLVNVPCSVTNPVK